VSWKTQQFQHINNTQLVNHTNGDDTVWNYHDLFKE